MKNHIDILPSKIIPLLPKITKQIGRLRSLPIFKSKKILIYAILVIVLAVGGFWFLNSRPARDNLSEATYVAEGPKVQLNKGFSVPIRDSKGQEVGSALKVNVTYLERTNELLYQGKPLVAKSGKDFLVINLEVENSTNNRLTVRPVDFFRLIDESGKSYAADIQTDSVKVEPQSSKKTRTIFIVNDNPKRVKMTIGEIKGDNKETVEISI